MKNIVTPVRTPTAKVNPVTFVDSTSNIVPASCETQVTPACLQAQYGIPAAPATQSSNRLGVSAFFFEYANNSDLQVRHLLRLRSLTISLHGRFIPKQSFLQTYRPDVESSSSYSVLSIDGGENSQDEEPGFEAVSVLSTRNLAVQPDLPSSEPRHSIHRWCCDRRSDHIHNSR